MNRAQRRQAARAEGHRGSKAKRQRKQQPTLPVYTTPTGEHLTQAQVDETIATAKRLRDMGVVIAPNMLWTPEQER